MNHRIESIVEGIKTIACCCTLKEMKWRVSYFLVNINDDHVWKQVEVMAYTRLDAAKKVGSKLRPGKNCFVTRVIG